MKFTRGNLALKNHMLDGRRVFLFEYIRSGHVKFVSELEFYEADYFETHDRLGDWRIGIKFFFKRAGVSLQIQPEQLNYDLVSDPVFELDFLKPNQTERSGLITSRVGQGAYRKSILHRWEYQCAVTGFKDPRILIASHIVPWKEATDEERLDVENGILLSPTFDALFDKYLITFDYKGSIVLSDDIAPEAYHKIGVTGKESLRKLSDNNRIYLAQHQKLLVAG